MHLSFCSPFLTMLSGTSLPNIDVPLRTRTPRVPPKAKRQGYVSFNPVLFVSLSPLQTRIKDVTKENASTAKEGEKNGHDPKQAVETQDTSPSRGLRSLQRKVELHPQVGHREHAWIIWKTSAATALFSTVTDFVAYWRRAPPLPPPSLPTPPRPSFSFLSLLSSSKASSTALSLASPAVLPDLSKAALSFSTPPLTTNPTALPTSSLTTSQLAARQARNEQPHRLLPQRTAAEWWHGLRTHLFQVAPGHFFRSALSNMSELALYAVFREQLRVWLAIGSSGKCLSSPYVFSPSSFSLPVLTPMSSHPLYSLDSCRRFPPSSAAGGSPKMISSTSSSFFFLSHLRNPNVWCGAGGGALGGALCAAVAHPYHVLDTTVRMECIRVPVSSLAPPMGSSMVTTTSAVIPMGNVMTKSGGTIVRRRFQHVGEVIIAVLKPPPSLASSSSSPSFLERWRRLTDGLRQGRRMAMLGGAVQGGVRFGMYELLREDGVYRHSAVLFFYCWLSSFAGVVCQYPCKTIRQFWFSAASLPSPIRTRNNGATDGGRTLLQHVTYRSVLRELRRTGGMSQLWLHFFSSRPMLCAIPSAFLLYSYDCLMRQEAEREGRRRRGRATLWEEGAVPPASHPSTYMAIQSGTADMSAAPPPAPPSRTTAAVDQSLTAMRTAATPLPAYEFRPPGRTTLL